MHSIGSVSVESCHVKIFVTQKWPFWAKSATNHNFVTLRHMLWGFRLKNHNLQTFLP